MVPLVSWLILREDLDYTYERMFDIGLNSVLALQENNNYKQWLKDGSKIKKYMVFNLYFLNAVEFYLIQHGHNFEWMYSNKTPIGIIIYPSTEYFRDNILNASLTLKEYSKHRLSLFED